MVFVVWKGVSNPSVAAFSQRKWNTSVWHRPRMSLVFCALVPVAVEQECYSVPAAVLPPFRSVTGPVLKPDISIRGACQSTLWNTTEMCTKRR